MQQTAQGTGRGAFHYHVGENTPGYLPDSPVVTCNTLGRASGVAEELAEGLRGAGYQVRGTCTTGFYGERDGDGPGGFGPGRLD